MVKQLIAARHGWPACCRRSVDTVIFITISFARAVGLPILGKIMEGQIVSKLLLSTIMVPPFIWLFVRLGRRLDRGVGRDGSAKSAALEISGAR